MISMKRTAAVMPAEVFAGAVLLAVEPDGTTAKKAAATVRLDGISPNPAMVGDQPVTVTIKVTSDGKDVKVGLHSPARGTLPGVLAGTRRGDLWTFRFTIRQFEVPAQWNVTPFAVAADGSMTDGRTVLLSAVSAAAVKADTRFSDFQISPQSTLEGRPVHFSGRLKALVKGRMRGLAHKSVDIVFEDGSTVASVTTNGQGAFVAHTTAATSGAYHASFAGDRSADASVSASVLVRVVPDES
ncbi:hypothetical protein J5X84_16030 [Streptosporangiaceae bacterium NEAU-GS5]|nr:hypothetical protein [Streptosporangiaceae bacterium NEAU-GS5]